MHVCIKALIKLKIPEKIEKYVKPIQRSSLAVYVFSNKNSPIDAARDAAVKSNVTSLPFYEIAQRSISKFIFIIGV